MKKRTLVISTLVVLALATTILITSLDMPIVSAVQNIFIGLGKVKDIKYGGKDVNKVVYRGEVIWEREPPPLPSVVMQTVTASNCSTARTKVADARDSSTYWVQKLADGKCWMLTNLAYGGGGTNTYNDVKSITNGSTSNYTQPFYFIPPGANRTVEPQDPSTSTTGTGQYGYLYNWCAAMGVQTGTAACLNTTTPAPNSTVSICPKGWRLPTIGEYQALTTAIGATNDIAGSTAIRAIWLAMYGGLSAPGFSGQGDSGRYWPSTPTDSTQVKYLLFGADYVSTTMNNNKQFGFAVRCVAS